MRKKTIMTAGISAFALVTLAGCGTTAALGSPQPNNNVTTNSTVSTGTNAFNTSNTSATNQTATSTQIPNGSSTNAGGNSSNITLPQGSIIAVVSPAKNQSVKPGSTIIITGKVASGFENQILKVTLFSGTDKVSKILQSKEFRVGNNGTFSGSFEMPNSLPPSGTEMQLILELLVHGGPQYQTTLKVQ